jgi:hypothetical protein
MKWHHGLIALGAIALSACGESQTASTDADSQYGATSTRSEVASNETAPADPNASTYTTPDATSQTETHEDHPTTETTPP